jgi:hypothetical protein
MKINMLSKDDKIIWSFEGSEDYSSGEIVLAHNGKIYVYEDSDNKTITYKYKPVEEVENVYGDPITGIPKSSFQLEAADPHSLYGREIG